MSKIDYPGFYRTAKRQAAARRRAVHSLNRRTGVLGVFPLALALLASAACIAPPFVAVSLAQTPDAGQSQDAASYATSHDYTFRLHADRTGEFLDTRRVKVLGIAAVDEVAQQTIQYVEGMQNLDIVEAFTEKADGTKVPVDSGSIVTRDAASGLASVFLPGAKAVTVIFPDVAVGDTLVLTTLHRMYRDTFAGHLEQSNQFDRSIAIAPSTMRVIAPSSLPLTVGVQGAGVQHMVMVEGTETRHLITVPGAPPVPAEDRMTSRLDRDPGIFITTLAGYEDLARNYWNAVRGAIEVTPEIARLAEEITQGISDKRAQARAVSAWIKANVSYVSVPLGAVRVEAHNAAAVLKSRYGDAKDLAVLASALLAAKGIAAEHVLLNDGGSYTLPEPATMAHIEDVIVYLPEFGIYDDPGLQHAPFGVLAIEEYDKPAVHVSDGGARLARTFVMKPGDHAAVSLTRLSLAADGTVSGETLQSGTGVFATTLRSFAVSIQTSGLEESAAAYMRNADTPGKGRFETGSLTELGDSYSMQARFTYDEPVNVKPSADLAVPAGLTVLSGPGDFLFGTRVPGRRLPFTCFAATQIEEIEIAFAEGVPLPRTFDSRRIETKSFVYDAGYRLEGRTLKIRREFVSRTPGQVCAPEVEAEIAGPMRDVAASRATHLTLAPGALENEVK
jgi:hypothetical protein